MLRCFLRGEVYAPYSNCAAPGEGATARASSRFTLAPSTCCIVIRHSILRTRLLGCASLVALLLSARALGSQPPSASVGISFNIDTSTAQVAAIVRLTQSYLRQPDTTARSRGLWSSADSLDRRAGDLTRFHSYQGYPATVVGVSAAGPGDSVYVVKVLHASADSSGERFDAWALQRLYAVHTPAAPHGWQLSNALPRTTRGWPARTVGRITFHYAPGQRPDEKKANRAALFVDSVAALFGVAPPERLDYYVTTSPDEYYRALGLDFVPMPSGSGTATGGNTIAEAAIVLTGDPGQGEAYLHELVHAVLGRLGGGAIVGEGIPIWLGGSKGRPLSDVYRSLSDYQIANPEVTLEALVSGEAGYGASEAEALNATGALFVDAVYRRAGIGGLRALLETPRGRIDLQVMMRSHLAFSASDTATLEGWWREAAVAAAGPR